MINCTTNNVIMNVHDSPGVGKNIPSCFQLWFILSTRTKNVHKEWSMTKRISRKKSLEAKV